MLFILNGSGVPSVAKIVRLGAAAPPPGTVPAAPSALAGNSPTGSRRVDLSWTDNSGNESGFRIERSSNGSTFAQIGTVAANVRTYQNTGLTRANTYWYRVRAYNGTGNSPYTNTVSVRVR